MERIRRVVVRTVHLRGQKAWLLVGLALCALVVCFSAQAQAATATNSGAIVGDWSGTAADDHYTNTSTGTIGGTADMTQGGSDVFINYGAITNFIRMSSDGYNTINNVGTASILYGSINAGTNSSGGYNTVTNSGTADVIYGSNNVGDNSSGGYNTITSTGTVTTWIYGSYNAGAPSSGGYNTITNSGTVANIAGTFNSDVQTNGVANTINNSGSVTDTIYGTYNAVDFAEGGSNSVNNTGSVADSIIGTYNGADDSSGGSNTITNSGTVDYIDGTWSIGDRASGGSNTIINTASGRTTNDIFGSCNDGVDSTGGSNTISNAGTAGMDVYGSYNHGSGSSGGSNYIYNTGTVLGSVYGSYNEGANSSGGGNYITNSGYVAGSIYGSYNTGAGASATGNAIVNSGRVGGGIYGGSGNDTVHINSGSSVGGVVDGQDGTDTLYLSASGTQNADKYLNFENAGYTGRGFTTLTGGWSFNLGMSIDGGQTTIGDSTYASVVIVNSGVLNLVSVLTAGGVNINSGGYLTGNGSINSNVVVGGTVSPGNSIGTINISGVYTSQAGSVYACEIASDGTSDRINAGSAVLQGGTVMAYLDNGIYTSGQNWTILATNGTISGTYDAIESPSLAGSRVLSLALDYTASSVSVVFNRASYASFGSTPNNRIIGTALDGIAPLAAANGDDMATLLEIVDWSFSESQIDGLLAALNPEMYDGLSWAALAGARRFDSAMQNRADWSRMARLLGAPLEGQQQQYAGGDWSVWVRAIGGWNRRASDSGYMGYESDSGGVLLGADGAVLPWLRVGVALSGDETKVGFSQQANNGEQKGFYGGLYAAADFGDFYLNGAVSYSQFTNDTNRSVAFDGYGATAMASYDGNAWLASLDGGWGARLAGWLVGPMAGLDYLSLSEDSFSESGAGFLNLNVKDRSVDYWSSALGLRAAGRYDFGGWALIPRAQLAWRHLFSDDRRDVMASISGYGGNSFTVYGLEQVGDWLEMQAGVNAAIGGQANVFLQYGLDVGQGQSNQEVTLGFNWLF